MVAIFLGETPGRLDATGDALARGDGDALARTAHVLTSSRGSLGPRRMEARCGEVEGHGRRGTTDAVAPLLASLPDELGRAEPVLDEAIRRDG